MFFFAPEEEEEKLVSNGLSMVFGGGDGFQKLGADTPTSFV